MNNLEFFNKKRVLITGHTGFKGSWMCQILTNFGAEVIGYGLNSPTNPSLFNMLNMDNKIKSIIADIRDIDKLEKCFYKYEPEIVIHLAAQPIVIEGYLNPRYTYETNVMGTVNLLECIKKCNSVKSVLNVTTDKVYKNYDKKDYKYKENDILAGEDPYSNSKSCSELITHTYIKNYFYEKNIPVSTARAGNVIGGGDFAINRIIPDCIRAVKNNQEIIIRNPNSIRPYQHVLEAVMTYLMIIEKQYKNISYSDCYNIGPNEEDCITTEEIVNLFCKYWGNNAKKKIIAENQNYEANFLKLDVNKIKDTFNWRNIWNIDKAVQKTVELAKLYEDTKRLEICMNNQIEEFLEERNKNV